MSKDITNITDLPFDPTRTQDDFNEEVVAVFPSHRLPSFNYHCRKDGTIIAASSDQAVSQYIKNKKPCFSYRLRFDMRPESANDGTATNIRVDKVLALSYYRGRYQRTSDLVHVIHFDRRYNNNNISNLGPCFSLQQLQGYFAYRLGIDLNQEFRVMKHADDKYDMSKYLVSDEGVIFGLEYQNFLRYVYRDLRSHVAVTSNHGPNSVELTLSVHRAVASTFYPEKKSVDKHVHHIDLDPTNNKKTNLLWCTPEEHARIHAIEGKLPRPANSLKQTSPRRRRCFECGEKEANLSNCSCGFLFCSLHLVPGEHNCNDTPEVRSYFKDIGTVDGWDFNNYEANQLGEIRNKTTKQILAPSNSDYHHGKLMSKQGLKNVGFNRLVATAWLSHLRGEGQDEVDHKDSQTRNNNVRNLHWMTHRENMVAAQECPIIAQKIGEEDFLFFDCLKDCQKHFRDQYGNLSHNFRFNDIFEIGDHLFCRQEKQPLTSEYWYLDV